MAPSLECCVDAITDLITPQISWNPEKLLLVGIGYDDDVGSRVPIVPIHDADYSGDQRPPGKRMASPARMRKITEYPAGNWHRYS
jgi:hypothetical protein